MIRFREKIVACIGYCDTDIEFIEQAIKSVHPFVDQTVIIQNGKSRYSTKGYKHIRNVKHEWTNNYAAMRNHGQLAALEDKANWIIWLDADEKLRVGWNLRDLLNAVPIVFGGLAIPIYSRQIDTISGQVSDTSAYVTRIVRGDSRYRWWRPVHEAISDSIILCGHAVGTLSDSQVSIIHKGYDHNAIGELQLINKYKKYLGIINNHLQKHSDDGYAWYKKAELHYLLKQWDKALETYKYVAEFNTAYKIQSEKQIKNIEHFIESK